MSNPSPSEENKATVERMWTALSQFDFDTLKSCLHPDVHYEDVPTGDAGAIGPENVVARLSVAWDHISEQIQSTHRIAADGDVVFLDHTEEWIFKTGESVKHRFATMHAWASLPWCIVSNACIRAAAMAIRASTPWPGP